MTILNRVFIIYIIIAFCSIGPVLGGNGFPGYCVKMNGDTIKGSFPNYSQWLYNPDSVNFLVAASKEMVVLKPLEYKMFAIDNGEKYVSYSGGRLVNSSDSRNAGKDGGKEANEFNTISTFLRSIAAADDYEFFVFNDKNRTNLYYKKSSESVNELIYKVYTENNTIKEDQNYKKQLASIFSSTTDTANINELLEKTKYTEESLVRFIEKVKSNKGGKIDSELTQGIIAALGIGINSFYMKGTNNEPYVTTPYDSKISPAVGIGYIFPINWSFPRYFLYPQLRFYNFENTGSVKWNETEYFTTHKTDLAISLTLNVGYHIVNKSNLNFYVAPGIGVLGMVNNRMIQDSVVYNNSIWPIDPIKPVEIKENSAAFKLNINGGLIINKRYVIWGEFNIPAATVTDQYYTGYHTSIQAGLGYMFQ